MSDFLFLKQLITCCGSIICSDWVVSTANIHIIRKQFTTADKCNISNKSLFQLQIYTLFESNSQLSWINKDCRVRCFNCKYTHYSKAIHNRWELQPTWELVVSTANIHIIRKQFTTQAARFENHHPLFQLQIYTLFESNSQHLLLCQE